MSDDASYVPTRCGDCGAWDGTHFPDCLTLREQQAGVEVRTTFSNGGRTCPRCGKEMTRNHDQQSDTWTWNCTGAMCGVTMDALPPPPELADVEQVEVGRAYDEIAAMPESVEWVWVAKPDLERLQQAEELLKDAGLLLHNLPATDDFSWEAMARKVLHRIHDALPGGIP